MLNVEQILFPSDFSDTAEAVFIHALRLARRYDAALHALHVAEGRIYGAARLKKIEARAEKEGVRATSARRELASAAAGIVEGAHATDADLVVMGTRGQSGVRRLVMGSVAEEVVRRSPCPVFTVRRSEDKNQAAPEAPEDLTGRVASGDVVKRILAPVDFSASSRLALAHAKELATTYGASVDVLHITSQPDLRTGFTAEAVPSGPSRREREQRRLETLVEEAGLNETGVATSLHVEYSYPHGGILDFAGRCGTDLIVMATHGQTGLNHFTMGSVAEKVVRQAPCPVFVVPSFGKSLVEAPEPAPAEVR